MGKHIPRSRFQILLLTIDWFIGIPLFRTHAHKKVRKNVAPSDWSVSRGSSLGSLGKSLCSAQIELSLFRKKVFFVKKKRTAWLYKKSNGLKYAWKRRKWLIHNNVRERAWITTGNISIRTCLYSLKAMAKQISKQIFYAFAATKDILLTQTNFFVFKLSSHTPSARQSDQPQTSSRQTWLRSSLLESWKSKWRFPNLLQNFSMKSVFRDKP